MDRKTKQFIFKHQNILNASDDCNVLHWRKSNNRTQKFVNMVNDKGVASQMDTTHLLSERGSIFLGII